MAHTRACALKMAPCRTCIALSLASKPCPDKEHPGDPGLMKTVLIPRLPSPLIRIDYTSGASTSKDLGHIIDQTRTSKGFSRRRNVPFPHWYRLNPVFHSA